MAIESASYISQLDSANPKGTDQRSTLDNHARLIKKALKQTLGALDSTVSATPAAINFVNGLTANAQVQLNAIQAYNEGVSANLYNQVASVSSALQASLLDLSATAANSILWNGSALYMQTATPVMSAGDLWFEPL